MTPQKSKVTSLPQRPFGMFSKDGQINSVCDDSGSVDPNIADDISDTKPDNEPSGGANVMFTSTSVSPDNSTEQGLRDAFRCVNRATLPSTPSTRHRKSEECEEDKQDEASQRPVKRRKTLWGAENDDSSASAMFDVGWKNEKVGNQCIPLLTGIGFS